MDNNLSYTLRLKDYFSKGIKGAANEVKGLDTGINSLNSKLGKLRNTFVGGIVAGSVIGFGSSVIDSLKNYESFSASLRTLMYGDKLAAQALETQLVSLAARTPFNLVDVQEGSKQLLAYGFSAGKVVENMEMLGDISAAVGKPLNELVYLYGTLRTQGRAFTKDINQFTTAGINLLPQLARQFGVTEDKVKDLVESGKVGFKDVEKAFQSMTREGGQFFGMMAVQAQTVGGQISMLGDNWEQLKVNIGKSQGGIISGTVSFLNEMTGALQKYFADSNKMSENFTQNGAKQFRWYEKALHETIGVLSGYGVGYSPIAKQENFQRDMSVYTKPKDLASAYSDKANLYRHSIGIDEKLKKGLINEETAKRFQATIQGALKTVEGSIKLFKNPQINLAKGTGTETGGTAAATKIGAATEVYGARPQNINITLDRLGDVTINATNITEGAAQTREIFSKQLLEVLNDANLMAGK